jgi:hypothetical protein
MNYRYLADRITVFSVITLMLFLTSCEKEPDYGRRLYSGDEPISCLYWSESSDEIFFILEKNAYTRSLYAVDINSRNSRKITDISTNYGIIKNQIYQKDEKLYYFNNIDIMNIKLYSLSISGSIPELIIDSLQTPVFSRKYVAYARFFNLVDTSYVKTFLYNIDNSTITSIESNRNDMPTAISPDGLYVSLTSWDMYGTTYLSIYDTQSGLMTELHISSAWEYFNFFWADDELFGFRSTITGLEIINMKSNNKVSFAEALTYGNNYILSPSGKMLAYVTEVPPAMAAGLVGNHYYLHILYAGSKSETTIDLERDYVNGGDIIFSPDETRIAYIRDSNDIFILNL